MSMTDPVADMLTRIRNASKAKHEKVDIPSSTLKAEVARILKEEGYIKNVKMVADAKQGIIRVFLKYSSANEGVITGIDRVSTPGRRMYVGLVTYSLKVGVTGQLIKAFWRTRCRE